MYKLEVMNSSKVFRKNGKEFFALKDTNLQIPEGKFISIIGPSGCGKSTLFNIIAGLIKPSTGNVLLDGKDIVGKKWAGWLYASKRFAPPVAKYSP